MTGILAFLSLRAISCEQAFIGTNNAVFSPQITILHAPIEGYIKSGEIAVGQSVDRSTVVETILESRLNDLALADLEGELEHILNSQYRNPKCLWEWKPASNLWLITGAPDESGAKLREKGLLNPATAECAGV
jgi:hypothetical protein